MTTPALLNLELPTDEPSAELHGDTSAPDFAGGRGVIAVLAPIAMLVIALGAHRYLPNRQAPLTTSIFAQLLESLLVAAVALAGAYLLWPASRHWISRQAPLFAGGV